MILDLKYLGENTKNPRRILPEKIFFHLFAGNFPDCRFRVPINSCVFSVVVRFRFLPRFFRNKKDKGEKPLP